MKGKTLKSPFIAVLLLLSSSVAFSQRIGQPVRQRNASVPPGVVVRPDTPGSHAVAASWTLSTSSNIAKQTLYRGGTQGGPYSKLVDLSATQTTYTDSTVVDGVTYYYVITASDGSGNESPYSNEAKAVVPQSPNPPTGLAVNVHQ